VKPADVRVDQGQAIEYGIRIQATARKSGLNKSKQYGREIGRKSG